MKLLLDNGADANARCGSPDSVWREIIPLTMTNDDSRGWEVAELLLGYTALPVTIRCEGCSRVYRIGVDACSMTSSELAKMIPGLIGRISTGSSPDLMIGRTKTLDREQLRRDCVTILRAGPESGWTCQNCHHDNEWRPTFAPPKKTAPRVARSVSTQATFGTEPGTMFGKQPPTKPWWQFW